MSELLKVERDGRLLRIELNRPDKRNALNYELCRELVAALDRGDTAREVGAILLTGAGPSFCAGMDLTEVLGENAGGLNALHEQLFTFGSRLGKPVVAAVEGAALAGGTGVLANCHVVVAADDARFGLTEIRLGLWPFIIFRAVALAMGERRAVELSLTGRVFGAQDALDWGLIHHVAPAAEVRERAEAIARQLADASPTAIRSGLMFVQEIRQRSWEAAGELARNVREQVFRGPDFREGVQAFLDKRDPKWPSLM